jgi:hypothetical protein
MGKPNFERDSSGMKLFGRCKKYGNCVCGNCSKAPVNQSQTVMVTHPDGRIEEQEAPAVNPAEYEPDTASKAAGWGTSTNRGWEANRKRCPSCNMFLRKDHKCKGPGNGPVKVTKPAPPLRPPSSCRRLHLSAALPHSSYRPRAPPSPPAGLMNRRPMPYRRPRISPRR